MGKGRKLFKPNEGQMFPAAGQLKSLVEKVNPKNRGKKRSGNGEATGPPKAKLGFKMNKKLGQHLLKNPGIVTKILDAASIQKSDVVLEIGPGTGNLTVQLCARARKVVALEIDTRMVAEVKKRCLAHGYTNFEIKEGDALKTDFGQFHICTANLPYQISSPFIFRLVTHPHPFKCAVLMFQKEFGERLVAQPGDKLYCRLGVNTQVFCKVTRVCAVSAASFNPPPKVDSIVVKLCPTKEHQISDHTQWDGMLRILFSRKNKTVAAAFKMKHTLTQLLRIYEAYAILSGKVLQLDEGDKFKQFKDLVHKVICECGFEKNRAINMSIADFKVLQSAFHSAGIYFAQREGKRDAQPLFDWEDDDDEPVDDDEDVGEDAMAD